MSTISSGKDRQFRPAFLRSIFEKTLYVILILSMLLSNLAIPTHSVSAAPVPDKAQIIPNSPKQSEISNHSSVVNNAYLNDGLPDHRPVVIRPEPRKGVRPQTTTTPEPPIPGPIDKQNSGKRTNVGPLQAAPLMFIENVGQFDSKTKFQIKGVQDTIYFAQNEFWVTTLDPETFNSNQLPQTTGTPSPGSSDKQGKASKQENKATKGVNLRFEFLDAASEPRVEGFDRLDTIVSFIEGNNPKNWRSNVPVWGGIRYVDIYPGVDLEVKSEEGQWSWQLVVKDEAKFASLSNTNKKGIALRVHGAKGVSLDQNSLKVNSESGDFLLPILTLSRPNIQAGKNSQKAAQPPQLVDNELIIVPPDSSLETPSTTVTVTSQAQTLTPPMESSPIITETPVPGVTQEAIPITTQTPIPTATISPTATETPTPIVTTPLEETGTAPSPLPTSSTEPSRSSVPTQPVPATSLFTSSSIQVDSITSPSITRYLGQTVLSAYYPGNANTNNHSEPILSPLLSGADDLVYSTYLHGTSGYAIAVDSDGAMYIAGDARAGNFPVSSGAFQNFNEGNIETIVQKLSPGGDQSLYATYIGGAGDDEPRDIAVDKEGNAYITGRTLSTDFPLKDGALESNPLPGDAFVSKLNPTGTDLVYSTYLGGTGGEQGLGIAVNSNGEAYIVGQTTSSDLLIKIGITSGSYDQTKEGDWDGFVVKLNKSGTRALYGTFIGGGTNDCEIGGDNAECGIAIDETGAAYISGSYTTGAGSQEAFVLKLSADGSRAIYNIDLGNSGIDGNLYSRIAVDKVGSAYVVGTTNDPNFPHTFGTFHGGRDAFLVKVRPDGQGLVYSMLIGGSGDDRGKCITVDEYGAAYIVGDTNSTDFPTSEDAYSRIISGIQDPFLVKVSSSGTGITYSSYFGGSGNDWAKGITIDRNRYIYITGPTDSSTFPTQSGLYQTQGAGYVSKFNLGQYTKVTDISAFCPPCDGISPTGSTQMNKGDPINTRTGVFTESFDYLSVPTRAGNLSFKMAYASSQLTIDRYNTLMGYGWTNNHDLHLIFPEDTWGEPGTVLFKSSSENQYRFFDNGNGTYTPDSGVVASLLKYSGPPVTYSITDKSRNVYLFDDEGKIISWTTPQGFYWTYTYDGSNRLHRVTDDTGLRYLEFGYDAQNRIQSLSDQAGSITLGYDAAGDLTTLIDPLTHTWTFTYDSAHHLRLLTDPEDVPIIHTEYDAQGRAYRQFDSQGHLLLEIVYNSDGTTQISNALEGVETHSYSGRNVANGGGLLDGSVTVPLKMYDPNFRPSAISDGNGENTQLTWSSDGVDLTKAIDPENNSTDLGYDSLHNLTSVIDAKDNLTTFTYDTGNPDPTRHTLLTQSEDALHNVTNYEYTTAADAPQPSGLLKTIISPTNQRTSFTYNQFGQRMTVINPQGETTTYAYDTSGRVKSVQNPFGKTNWTCYDATGRVIRLVSNASGDGTTPQTDPCNAQDYQPSPDTLYDRISLTFYDLRGNVIGTVDPTGLITRTFFDALNRPHFVTQNLKDPLHLDATPSELLQLSTPPAFDPAYPDRNITNETRYDNAGNVIATIDPAGIVSRTYYDQYNRPVYVTRNLKDPANLNASVDELLSLQNPPTYDQNHPDRNLTTQTIYDLGGNVIATKDPAGVITRTYYDGNNRTRFVVQNLVNYDIVDNTPPTYNPVYPDQNIRTETQYDETGNPFLTIDPLGTKTRSCYDALGRVERTVINPSGNGSTPEQDPCDSVNYIPSSAPDIDRITDTIYDGDGKVIATIDPVGVISRTYYDLQGRQIAVTTNLRDPADPDASLQDLLDLDQAPAYDPAHPDWNITTKTVYDENNGNTIAAINPNGVITRTYYDSQNRPFLVAQNLTSQSIQAETPPTFNPAQPDQNIITQTIYDADGQTIASISNDGVITRTYYDQLRRPVFTVKNLTGQAITVATPPTYDPAHPDQNVRTQTVYAASGSAAETIDPSGKVSYSCFDGASRLVKAVINPTVTDPCVSYTSSIDPAEDIISYTTYDAAGNRHATIDPDGNTTYYQYDAINRLTQKTDPLGNTTKYSYDAAGNQVTKTDARNIVTYFEYDELGELKAVIENYVVGAGSTNEQNVRTEYTYDKRGNRLTIKDALTHVTSFTYDALNRLTGEQDALNHLTSYGYDAEGNRISVLDANGATTNYAYDAVDRLLTITFPAPDPSVTFTYDAAGNRKTMVDGSGTTQWTYDELNRAIDIAQPNTGTVHYGYNAAGDRTSLTYPDTKAVNYTFDDAGRLRLVTGWDTLITTYTYDKGSRIQARDFPNNVTSTYSYDNAGNLQSLRNFQTTQTLSSFQYTYDETGNRKVATESLPLTSNPPGTIVFDDGFENGDLSAWSNVVTDGGRLTASSSAAILGSYGMAASINSSNPIYVQDQTPASANRFSIRFYYDPNSLTMAAGDSHVLFQELNAGSSVVAQLELRFSAGDYQLRGGLINDSGNWTNSPWSIITDGPHAVELDWYAASAAGVNNGGVELFIDGSLKGNYENIDNDAKSIESTVLGAVAGLDAGTSGTEYFDGFTSRSTGYIGIDPAAPPAPPRPTVDTIFSDGFESGDMSAWSSSRTDSGYLSVTAQAAIAGTSGLQALVYQNHPIYVTDWSLFDEPRHRVRFYFDPNTIHIENGDAFDIFHANNLDDLVIAKIELRFSAGDYQLRESVIDDAGIWNRTTWETITDSPHALEIDWKAANAVGGNDGSSTFWIDGIQKAVLNNLDNDTHRIDYAQMGYVTSATNYKTTGTCFFDDYESRRNTYIGLDEEALPPTQPPAKIDSIFSDGFEAGDLNAWSAVYPNQGAFSVTDRSKFVGNKGLEVPTHTYPRYLIDWSPFEEKTYRARFYFDPNSILMYIDSSFYIFIIGSRDNPEARIALLQSNDAFQIRAEVVNNAGVWSNTPWIAITDNFHAFEINWQAATAPGVNNGSLDLWVDGILRAGLKNIDNDAQSIDYANLGAVDGIDSGTSGTIYFDGYVSHRNSYIGPDSSLPSELIFGDGFERGDLSTWSASVTDGGNLSVGIERPIIGNSYELLATINDNNPIYVTDLSPTAEPRYRARFYFDPHSISMADGDAFLLFEAQDSSSNPLTRIEMRYLSGKYQLRSQLINDSGIWGNSGWAMITDSPHAVEFDWQAASSAGADNGNLTFWIDNNIYGNLSNIDNDVQRIETVQMGAVAGIDDSTRGTFYMDGFESHHTTFIGLDPAGNLQPLPNPIFSDGFETSDLSNWSNVFTDGGHLSVSSQAALVGSFGVQAVVSDNNALYLEDASPYQAKSYNARFYIDPNSINLSVSDSLTIYNELDRNSVVVARIKIRIANGEYQIQGDALDDSNNWHSTSWVHLSDAPHAIELDRSAASYPYANNGRMTLKVDNKDALTSSVTNIDDDTRTVEYAQLGIISGVSSQIRGTVYFDAIASQYQYIIGLDRKANPILPSPDGLFSDGFESGDLSAWSSSETDSGHLSASAQAAIIGSQGMQATISNNNEMYVADWKPSEETRYRVRFYFDPNSISMSNYDTMELFSAYDWNTNLLLKIELQNCYGNYQLHASTVIDGDVGWTATSWVNITDAPHAIEVDWQAATAVGANNGVLTFWVDGIQRDNFTSIDNDQRFISYVHLGVKPVGTPNIQGTVYFDAFESHRSTYIGLDSGMPLPELFSDGFESGNLATWSSTEGDGNSLAATTNAVIVGSQGLQVTIDDNNDNYVNDSKLNNEKRYRLRFYFDPNSISMANSDSFTIFTAENQADLGFRFAGGDYQVRSSINVDYETFYTPWVTINDGPHALELDWKASSSSSNPDGYINFWVDGVLLGNISSADNYGRSVNNAHLGAFWGINDGTRGSIYFDAFESGYTDYIGLDPSVPLPPAPPAKGDALFEDGFESGDLTAWSTNVNDNGHLSVTSQAAIIGTKGLQATIYGGSTNLMYVNDWKPWDESHYRARFYFDPNSVSMSDFDTIEIFGAYNRNGNILIKVEIQYLSGNYQLHASMSNDGDTYSAVSPWVNIVDAPHAVEIEWRAATAAGANNGGMTFWVDGVQRAVFNTIDNDERLIDFAHLGVKLIGNPDIQGTIYFDGFDSRRTNYIGLDAGAPAPSLFSDGFESGSLSAWSGNEPDGSSLSVTTGAAIVGSKGLQVAITDNNDKYVYDQQLNNETRYRARFYFDPNTLSMATLDSFTIFTAVDQANVEFRFSAGDYQVRTFIVNDNSTNTYSPWVIITDGPHALELDWMASLAAGANNGYLTFWVDGTQQGNITSIDNDTRTIGTVRMGAFTGIHTTTRGNVFFDGFESRYSDYIGLDPNALTPPPPPTKTDALFTDTFESGNLTNWQIVTTTGGDLSASTQAAITGAYGLKVLQDDTSADYVTDWRPFDETQYRARFYLKTNGINLVENTPLYIFYVLNREGAVEARIALQNSNGDYQVKAEAVNDAGSFTTASTGWIRIWEGLHAVEINWQAATASGANNGVFTLWIDGAQQATFTTVDNDQQRVDQAQLGAISGMNSGSNGSLYIDLFESRRNTYIGLDGSAPSPQTSAPDLIYANGFESGNFTGWSSSTTGSGKLSVTTASKVGGNYGMQAQASSSNTSLYVVDKRPSSETQYRARFYFKPNGITLGDTQVHYLLYGQQGTSSPATILRLEFRKSLGDYQVRASAYNDSSAWQSTQWYYVANQLYYFEVNWQAASAAGANNGVLTLWMDGTQMETITNLDTDTRRVDQIQFGQIAGTLTGATGTDYYDLYESRRTSYIGADASAPTPPAPPTPPLTADAIFSNGFESGSFSAWSANTPNSGNLSVTTGSKHDGTYGLSAYINNNNAEYVTDWTPWLEPHYRAQFWFHPNGITMATNDAHYIFYAISHDGLVVARVEFGKIASGYQIRAGAVTDASSSTFTNLAWTTAVTSAWHKIEIEWKAASAPGANDGVLTLWMDGVQKATVTTLDNDTRRVDGAQLGAVAGIDSGTRGTEYFDTFVSRRTTYIGMVAPGGIEVAKNPLPAPSQADNGIRMAAFTQPKQSTSVGDSLPVSLAPMLRPAGDLETHAITYTYDPLNRLTSAYYANGSYFIYTYDAVGNRLTETTQTGTTTYTYDVANRLATVNGVAYTWDNNGNLLNDGTSTYTYDHANRLKSVTTGGTTYSYAYNGLGDRVSQTVGGVTTYYTLDLNAGLTQVLADGTNTYLYGNERIAQYNGVNSSNFLGDALGSVRQLAGSTGAVTLTKSYKPFGDLLSSAGTGTTVYGFDAEMTDPTGLVYLRARFYSSSQGRFISRDTWSGDSKQPMSYNAWIFLYEDPINSLDPSGQKSCENSMMGCGTPPPVDNRPPDYDGPDGVLYPTLSPRNIHFIGEDVGLAFIRDSSGKESIVKDQFLLDSLGEGKWIQQKDYKGDGDPNHLQHHGLCGLASLSVILYHFFPNRGISFNDVVDAFQKFRPSIAPDEQDAGGPYGMERFINTTYSSYAKATPLKGYFDLDSKKNELTNTLQKDSYYLAGVVIPSNSNKLTRKGVGHWVVITGISAEWNYPFKRSDYAHLTDEVNDDSPWKWFRIYNPFYNQTEYYPYSLFQLSNKENYNTLVQIDKTYQSIKPNYSCH